MPLSHAAQPYRSRHACEHVKRYAASWIDMWVRHGSRPEGACYFFFRHGFGPEGAWHFRHHADDDVFELTDPPLLPQDRRSDVHELLEHAHRACVQARAHVRTCVCACVRACVRCLEADVSVAVLVHFFEDDLVCHVMICNILVCSILQSGVSFMRSWS